jgi:hypothetical protein
MLHGGGVVVCIYYLLKLSKYRCKPGEGGPAKVVCGFVILLDCAREEI